MSLFRSIGRLLRNPLVTSIIPGVGPVATAINAGRSIRQTTRRSAGLGAAQPPVLQMAALPTILRGGASMGRGVAQGFAGGLGATAAQQLFDSRGNPVGTRKKRKRINPNNQRALKRALRRIEMYATQNKRIERALTKAAPRKQRRAPPRAKC